MKILVKFQIYSESQQSPRKCKTSHTGNLIASVAGGRNVRGKEFNAQCSLLRASEARHRMFDLGLDTQTTYPNVQN